MRRVSLTVLAIIILFAAVIYMHENHKTAVAPDQSISCEGKPAGYQC